VLVVASLLGLIGCVRVEHQQRTQGGINARYVAAQGAPGDVIGFCPDQLGPAAMRDIPDGFTGLTFPRGGDPYLIDWIEYEERQKSASPSQFAHMLDQRAGPHTVWLIWAEGYRTLGHRCERTVKRLTKLRPGCTAVIESGGAFEHSWLYQCGPVPH
jgi:hypothetical protein